MDKLWFYVVSVPRYVGDATNLPGFVAAGILTAENAAEADKTARLLSKSCIGPRDIESCDIQVSQVNSAPAFITPW